MRMIYVSGIEKNVPIKAYMKAVNLAKENPDMTFKTGLTCWWACTGKEIVAQYWKGVEDRINAAIPYVQRGAK